MVLILFRARRGIWNIGGRALRLSVNDVGADAFQRPQIRSKASTALVTSSATIFGATMPSLDNILQ